MAKTSPTSRSLKLLRDRGWIAEKVEQRIPFTHVTRDFAGGIDIIAFRPAMPVTVRGFNQFDEPVSEDGVLPAKAFGIVGVQTTTQSNIGARRTKLLAEPRLRVWIKAGGRLILHGWAIRGAKGTRKKWTCVEEELTLEQFATSCTSAAPS